LKKKYKNSCCFLLSGECVGNDDLLVEEYKTVIWINKNNILKALILIVIGLFIGGILSYNFSDDYITIGLSLIIGFTISVLGGYFSLINQPLYIFEKKEIQEEEEPEFQSTMKVE